MKREDSPELGHAHKEHDKENPMRGVSDPQTPYPPKMHHEHAEEDEQN
ncbi:hypothetical protein QS713_07470 [Gleimia hominis]|uniref:Uncharacterized protein n=1 Tax=Gleimia hominis TaxID=595468 RepID=A0ABU3IBZ7_9ACTO|nr:hypothetical protein [Gleimia hominis]MDT3767897.1 hypothetical protein [Gleimia hominis]